MHNILGIVKVVIGEVFAVAVDGTQRQLHEGDRILAGEEIVTGANGALTVSLSDGHTMDMGRNSHWGEQSGLRAAVNSGHATDDVAALQQAIADGVDPTKALEATAAGNEAPIEAGTGGGGHFIEHVELTGKVLDVTSGFSTSSLDVRSLRGDEFTPLATQTSTSLNGTRITIDPIIAGEGNNTESLQPLEPIKPPQTDFPQPPHETDHNDVPAVDHPDRNPEASITINVVADDDIINAQESQQLTTNITGTVGGDAKAGDTVTLTVNGNTFTGTVEVQHDGSLGYRIPVTTTDLVSGQTVQATITTTDAAGNTATASADHAVGVDTAAAAEISIHPVAGDDVINAAESAAATTPVTGTVSGDAKAGDTVTLTVNGNTFTGTVEVQHDGSLGYRIPVTTTDLVSGQKVHATITTTDAAGNTATASADHAVGVDMGAAAGITVHPVAGDDVINAAESAAATTPVTGTVSGDAKAGDTVTLTVNGNTFTGTVEVQHDGSLGYRIPVTTTDLVSGQKVHATITTTDAAGNTATASADHAVGVDTEAAVEISIHPVAGDDVINASESTESLTPVTGTVSGDAKAGDTVTLTVNGHAFTGTVEVQHDGSLGYRIPVTTTDLVSGQTVQATITTTDAAGNIATASADHAVGVDREAEAGITVHPVTADGVINASESTETTTAVTGTVSGDAKAGDTVTLTVNGQTFTGPVQDLGNGQLGYSIPVTTTDLVSGQKVQATITTTDAAGNTATASADHAVGVDTAAEAGITVHPVTADGVINASESTESLTPVTGTVSGDAKAGDTVTLTVNGHTFTGTVEVQHDGSLGYRIPVTTTDLVSGQKVQATITTTDAAGNTASASADHAVGVDVSAQATITIDSVVTEDVPQTDGPQGTVIHVNGGSASADGFDVLDGKIVKIGSNVHIWLSEGDTRPECADPDTQIKYYQDGNVRGDGPYTDVFVVHPGSQYERSGDGFRDNLNSINGTTQNDQSGHKDYIFLQDGTTSDYQHSSGTNNNSEHNVNTLESINITGTNDAGQTLNLQGVNRIEGIIYGDGSSYTANGDRTVITHSNTPAATEQYSFINGTVSGDAQVNDVVTLTINGHEYTGTVQLMGNGQLGYSISVNSADLAKGQLIHATITATDDVGNTVTVSAESSISDNNLVSTENIVAQQPASAGSVANVDANHSASEAAAIDKPVHVDKPHAAITLINGGSGTADGFDVQDGKIVAIGSNVRIWLSDGDKEPLCADSANQIKHYGKDNNNGNPQGDGTHADVFVVHQGSGYLQDGNHRGLDAINGTTQQVEGGHKDYIFLQDGAPSDYTCTAGTNNNAASNVNTLENIALTGTHNDAGQGLHLQGVNHIEGVIYGDGTAAITASETRTTFEHHDTPAVTHASLMDAPSASAVDDSSGHALSNLLESGDDIFHPAPSAAADNAAHQGNHLLSDAQDGLFILTADQHSDVVQSWQPDNQGSAVMGQVEQINLSDLTHELEHGTDIASLIKDTGQPATEPALVDTKAHVAVEPGGMDSMQHSSFDHLLHKPEHQY